MTDERKEFILTVAKYFVLTGKSTRQLADIFKVSNATIHYTLTNQLEKLCEQDKNKEHDELYAAVKEVLDKNKNNQSIEDSNVKKRTLTAARLLINGMTIEQVALDLNSSFYTIYRDLTVRLPKIKDVDITIVEAVKKVMSKNSDSNLELGRMMPADLSKRERDEKGRLI